MSIKQQALYQSYNFHELGLQKVLIYQLKYKAMNRSIAKTRNQLQRITFKINQLKTKYTGQFTPTITADNSPMSHSHLRHRQSEENRPTISSFHQKNNLSGNKHHDDSSRDLKVFRNEIYNYVDKCLTMARDREAELMEKVITKAVRNQIDKMVCVEMQQSRMGQNKNSLSQKIKKIQEEATYCISNIEDMAIQNSKIEKSFNDTISNIDSKIKNQIQNYFQNSGISNTLKQANSLDAKFNLLKDQFEVETKKSFRFSQSIEELKQQTGRVQNDVIKKIEKITYQQQKSTMSIIESLQAEMQKNTQLNQSLSKQVDHIKIKLEVLKDVEQGIANQDLFGQIQVMINSKTNHQLNQHMSLIKSQIEELQNTLNFVSEKQKSFSKLEEKRETIFANSQKIMSSLQSQQQRIEIIQDQMKMICQKLQQQKSEFKSTISSLWPQIEERMSGISQSTQNKLKMEMENRINQMTQILKQQAQELTESATTGIKTTIQNVSIKNNQQNMTTISKLNELQQNIISTIQQQIKSKFDQEKEMLSNPYKPVRSVDHLQKHRTSPTQSKHSQSEPEFENVKYQQSPLQSNQRVQLIVQEKLNQFENDINETIKLLYEDIENRVNDLLSLSGIDQIKVDLEENKRSIRDMETKTTALTLIATTNPSQTKSQANEIESIEELRAQIFQQMGGQIQKISNILERTVEEIEIKVQKLDNNFEYVHERMSNIEFDNANFKDKLTAFITAVPQIPQQSFSNQIGVYQSPKQEQNSNLLDMLGQYNTGKSFFQNDN